MILEITDIETIAIEAAHSVYQNVPPMAVELLEHANIYAAAPAMLAALKGIEGYAQECIEDIACNIQEGGSLNSEELHRWTRVIDAIEQVNKQTACFLNE
jgi:hypothetical protein